MNSLPQLPAPWHWTSCRACSVEWMAQCNDVTQDMIAVYIDDQSRVIVAPHPPNMDGYDDTVHAVPLAVVRAVLERHASERKV